MDRIRILLVLNSEDIMEITKDRSMCAIRGVETCERVSSILILKLYCLYLQAICLLRGVVMSHKKLNGLILRVMV